MLIESKFRLYLVACPASSRAALYEPSPVEGYPGASQPCPNKPRAGPRRARRPLISTINFKTEKTSRSAERPTRIQTGESGIALGAAPQRESVCGVWILHRAHANDAAALPLHSTSRLGCLPRGPGGDGGDAPRGRGRLVVAAKRCCCCRVRRQLFVRLGAADARQLRGARAGPRRAAGLSAARGGSGSVRHDRQ